MTRVQPKPCGGRIVPHYGKVRLSDGYREAWGQCEICGKKSISAHVGNAPGFRYFEAACKDVKCGDKVVPA